MMIPVKLSSYTTVDWRCDIAVLVIISRLLRGRSRDDDDDDVISGANEITPGWAGPHTMRSL